MITIAHGDDLTSSRNYFLDLKHKQNNPVSYDGGKITLTDLVQDIEGSGLFEDTKTIFIENFLTKNKPSDKPAKEIIKFITEKSNKSAFILWESKEINKRTLASFKGAQVNFFKLPKNIFLLLDNLRPGNQQGSLRLFRQALASGIKEELILFMLQRQFRILLAISDPGQETPIEEVLRLAPWQTGKLNQQASIFGLERLKKVYKKLYKIELGQKTGSLPLSLVQSIDILFLEM